MDDLTSNFFEAWARKSELFIFLHVRDCRKSESEESKGRTREREVRIRQGEETCSRRDVKRMESGGRERIVPSTLKPVLSSSIRVSYHTLSPCSTTFTVSLLMKGGETRCRQEGQWTSFQEKVTNLSGQLLLFNTILQFLQ